MTCEKQVNGFFHPFYRCASQKAWLYRIGLKLRIHWRSAR